MTSDDYKLKSREYELLAEEVYHLAVERVATQKKLKEIDEQQVELTGKLQSIDSRGRAMVSRQDALEAELSEYEKTNKIHKQLK